MDWLADPETQKIIAFFAGGIAAVLAGAWAVFKYFHGSRERTRDRAPPSQTITADRGGIAAGHDAHVTRPQPSRKKRD
jgi:hypothetical protein